MKVLQTILCIALIIGFSSMNAQSWSILDTSQPKAYWDVVVKNDSFVVAGWQQDTMSPFDQHTSFHYYDGNGVKWKDETIVDGFDSYSNMKDFEVSEGKYFYGSFNEDTSGYKFVLYHFNEDLVYDSLSYYSIDLPEKYGGYFLMLDFDMEKGDSTILIVGGGYDLSDNNDGGDIILCRIHRYTGEKLAQLIIEDDPRKTLRCRFFIDYDIDHIVLAAGRQKELTANSDPTKFQLMIYKVSRDSLQIVTEFRSDSMDGNYFAPLDAAVSADGGLVLIGPKLEHWTIGIFLYKPHVYKLDGAFTKIEWTREIYSEDDAGYCLYDIEGMGMGNYILCGKQRLWDSTNSFVQEKANISVISEEGEFLLEKSVAHFDELIGVDHQFSKLHHYKDSVYLFVGHITEAIFDTIPNLDDPGWVYTLDLSKEFSTSTRDHVKEERKILLFPNPATHSAQAKLVDGGKIDKAQLYDQQGKLLREFASESGELSMDLSFMTKGIYFLVFISDGQMIGVEELVKM